MRLRELIIPAFVLCERETIPLEHQRRPFEIPTGEMWSCYPTFLTFLCDAVLTAAAS